MDLMTYMDNQDAWVAFPSVLQGLGMARASSSELLLFSENPVGDLGDLVACVSVFKVAGGNVGRLGVASPYPSSCWIRNLRAEGIRRVYFAAVCPESNPRRLPGASLIEVPQDLCPALHVRDFDGRATSVCGNRFDLLLLGQRQFRDQCFARWMTCRWTVPVAHLQAAASR